MTSPLEPGTEAYARRYTDWTSKGRLAYESTRIHLMTLFGGAKGGSKTVTGVRIFQTDISNYRDGIFVVMRRNYTDLHTTTRVSFDRFFPPELVIRKTENTWYCINNNEIWWHAADDTKDPQLEKTRGLEASAIIFDEASQAREILYENAPSLLRRPAYHIDDGTPLKGYIYYTSNPVPGKNWLKRHFVSPKTRKRDGRHHYIQSLPDDNECAPPGYIDTAFSTMTGALLDMLRFGNWDVEESDFVIIPATVMDIITITEIDDLSPIAAGIDVGLGRPDATVVYFANRAGQFWQAARIDDEYDTMRIADRLLPFCLQVQANGGKVAIDSGSVGKGVADRLNEQLEWGRLMPVNFGESAVEEFGATSHDYANRRAQLYWWARTDAEDAARTPHAPAIGVALNDALAEDIGNTYYLPKDGKLQIEPKKNITERIGRSPDDGDAFVLCNAARREMRMMEFTTPNRRDKETSSRRPRRDSSLTAGY